MSPTIRSKVDVRRSAVVLGFLLGAAPLGAQGSSAPTLNAGTRIRMTIAGGSKPVIGSVVSVSEDSISFIRLSSKRDLRDASMTVARQAVSRIETSSGMHRRPFRGLALGLATGVGTGALFGPLLFPVCHPEGFSECFAEPTEPSQSAAAGAILLGLVGGLTGVIAGAMHQSDDWHRVSLDRVAQLRVMPTRHGLAASLTLPLASSR